MLDGVRVLDFSRLLPGPYATLVLADLGADVLKIESPRGGDYLRSMPPLTSSAGKISYAFSALNSGKRSLAVDLKTPDGVAIIGALVAQADVVLESFRPGVMERLGLGYEALSAINPRVIYCAISGFGSDGPMSNDVGHDLNYEAIAGVLGLGGATPPPVPMADYAGSMWALVGILGALHERHRTGRGRFVDISMTDGAMGFATMALAPFLGGGAPPRPGADTLTGGEPCYRIYTTKDGGRLAVAPLEPKFFRAMCRAMGRDDLIKRQYGDPTLHAELEAIFATRSRDAWMAVLGTVESCVQPVLAADELQGHPLHQARGNFVDDTSGITRPNTPLRPRDAAAPQPGPALGADSASVLADLGYSPSRIAGLFAAGVIAGEPS